jgi:hypothetical protein
MAELALDREMALVAAQDVLDDGEPEASAAELARARAVDPVEALGEAGDVLPGDAGALVLHGYPHARAAGHGASRRRSRRHGLGRDPHHLPLAAIFDGVIDQVEEELMQLVEIADDQGQVGRYGSHEPHLGARRHRVHPLDHLLQECLGLAALGRRLTGGELDPRQGEQVVDEPGHPGGLAGQELQEHLAALGIVTRRPAQRLDDAQDRGQGVADLMTGIGHEVRAHPLDHHLLGLLA